MPLLGLVNGENVRRLSKRWDLTYGIKASLDLRPLKMEPALSQGLQHQAGGAATLGDRGGGGEVGGDQAVTRSLCPTPCFSRSINKTNKMLLEFGCFHFRSQTLWRAKNKEV